jgi:trk system potassium uptake protein TrkA
MRFVIVGVGRVGLRTARVITEADHEVSLVERDSEKLERASSRGYEAVEGDGSREEALLDAGVETADALGALTGDLNTNFAACMIAKHHGCRTVMRIDEDYREDIYREYAEQVDELIYPERLGAIAAKNALLGGDVRAIADVASNLQVLELTVTPESPMLGYTIGELELPGEAEVLAFGKADSPMALPLEDDSLETGDQVAVLADFEVLEDVHRIIVGGENLQLARGA